MCTEFTLSCTSLAKILLHVAKYPHLSVSGVVLAAPRKQDNSQIILIDTIPLFHGQLSLAPMLEIALTQIEKYYKSQDITIAGYYQATENLRDNIPDFIAMKVAEKIAENCNDACLIMVDNRKMCVNFESVPILLSQLTSDGKWKTKEKTGVHIESGSLEIISQLLQKKIHQDIFDFDNHLEDISCDWTNSQITKLIKSLMDTASY